MSWNLLSAFVAMFSWNPDTGDPFHKFDIFLKKTTSCLFINNLTCVIFCDNTHDWLNLSFVYFFLKFPGIMIQHYTPSRCRGSTPEPWTPLSSIGYSRSPSWHHWMATETASTASPSTPRVSPRCCPELVMDRYHHSSVLLLRKNLILNDYSL